MCTAVCFSGESFFFGRNLDYEHGFQEQVVVTPRNSPLDFRDMGILRHHYAMIGMGCVAGDTALYFDAVNEKGLAMAGLNFVGYAHYREAVPGMDNIPHFACIPWILAQCASVAEAKALTKRLNITKTPFRSDVPPSRLHWIIADGKEAITLETVEAGIRVYPNPVGVLTNNPEFDDQLFQLRNHMHLSAEEPENRFSAKLTLTPYSRGMGAIGLPGDLSSQSRFVRAAFVKENALPGETSRETLAQIFHILGAVEQIKGCCRLGEGLYEHTIYTGCCDADRGIYYYTTYENPAITAVELFREDLDESKLKAFSLDRTPRIRVQNG